MTILKTRKKNASEGKFTGVILPWRLSNYLTLYSLATGATKSIVVRDQMEEWCKKAKKENPENLLIEEIISRAKNELMIRRTHQPGLSLILFKKELADDLKRKGMKEADIFIVITAI